MKQLDAYAWLENAMGSYSNLLLETVSQVEGTGSLRGRKRDGNVKAMTTG